MKIPIYLLFLLLIATRHVDVQMKYVHVKSKTREENRGLRYWSSELPSVIGQWIPIIWIIEWVLSSFSEYNCYGYELHMNLVRCLVNGYAFVVVNAEKYQIFLFQPQSLSCLPMSSFTSLCVIFPGNFPLLIYGVSIQALDVRYWQTWLTSHTTHWTLNTSGSSTFLIYS